MDADKRFVAIFNEHLETIKSSQRNKWVLLEPLTNAYLYVNAVTNVTPRISDFDTPHYNSKKEFTEDVTLWEEWFAENKCTMTYERADSLFRAYAYGEKQE